MEVVYYNKKIVKFINSLDNNIRSDVYKTVDLLMQFGHEMRLPHSRSIGGGLFELRATNSDARLLYAFYKNKALILHAFIKKQNKIPKKELEIAKNRLKELA